MARKRKNYDNEILNLRAFYLKIFKRLPFVLLGTVLGAAIVGAIYFLATTVFSQGRNYKAESTLYIYFAYDENSGTMVDYFNAYTWNTLIPSNDILNPIMDELAGEGYSEEAGNITEDEIIASINCDIPSDVRVMILSVENKDKALTEKLARAAENSLVNFGRTNDAFTQIKILKQGETKQETVSDRSATAVGFGAVLGFVLTILGLLTLETMDDTVYVPEDIERRYHIPVVGCLTKKGSEEPAFFRNEMIASMGSSVQKLESIAVFSVDDKEGAGAAENGAARMKEVLGSAFDFEKTKLYPMALPAVDPEVAGKLKDKQGAIILVKMGKRNGAMTEHLKSMLQKLGCNVVGIVMTDCDIYFLRRYLGL